MNVLTIFDQRISAIFEQDAPGVRKPFSFKRLAKRAVREMEDETFVIDGVDTAPALYTILVAEEDDAAMRPLYIAITDEISQLVEAQAKKRGYTFVGRPLVRFMVDPALRPGRLSVFAENIDPRTLARLRDEENAYLGAVPLQDSFDEQDFVPEPVPVNEEEPAPVAQEVSVVPDDISTLEAGNEDEPEFDATESDEVPQDEDVSEGESSDDVPDFMASAEGSSPAADVPDRDDPFASVPSFADEPESPKPSVPSAADVPAPAAPVANPICMLVDRQSGQTYAVSTDQACIGRERALGGIVLQDPNVSRRHALLTFDGSRWHIRDLHSTNGTLVNNAEVEEAVLNDGDVLTIGLVTLEFRAG